MSCSWICPLCISGQFINIIPYFYWCILWFHLQYSIKSNGCLKGQCLSRGWCRWWGRANGDEWSLTQVDMGEMCYWGGDKRLMELHGRGSCGKDALGDVETRRSKGDGSHKCRWLRKDKERWRRRTSWGIGGEIEIRRSGAKSARSWDPNCQNGAAWKILWEVRVVSS